MGVDERLDPELLGPGKVSRATNCRFRNGLAEPRKGITILPWMKADGRTPFTDTGSLAGMALWKVSPPAAYGNYIGSGAPFAPDGSPSAVVGVRLGEVQNILWVDVLLDGSAVAAWSSANSALYPVGILVNGLLANTTYTGALNLQAQSFELVFSLSSLGGVLTNHYLEIQVHGSIGGGTGYLTYA